MTYQMAFFDIAFEKVFTYPTRIGKIQIKRGMYKIHTTACKWLDLEIAVFNFQKSGDYTCFLRADSNSLVSKHKPSSSPHQFSTPAVESSPITHKSQI